MSSYSGIEWVRSDMAWIIAGLSAFIGITISLYNIIKHIVYYTLPEQQLFIIRILFIVPLYAIVSFLSMIFIDIALYFEIFRDVYEAFVIYCFLILILGYVGGEANCVSLISLKPPLKHPCPLCFLPTIHLNVKFLRFCKQSCIQFIIIKPLFAVINIIMLLTDNYEQLEYQVFVSIVYNISYSVALYGLLLFYLACRDDIRAYSPVRKFMAIKIIVFATYWQGLFVSYFPGIPKSTAELWNDFILCIEMSIFAIIHLYSFPWWEFKTGMPSNRELMSKNARKVLSIKDVVRDVYHNIAPTYQSYVLQTGDGKCKEYKTKTFIVGNLNNINGKNNKYDMTKLNNNSSFDGSETMTETVTDTKNDGLDRLEITKMNQTDFNDPSIIDENKEDKVVEIDIKDTNDDDNNDNDNDHDHFEHFGQLKDITDMTPPTSPIEKENDPETPS